MASATRSIIDALADCILLVETDGTGTCANAAAGQAFRADPATLTGRNLYDLIDDPDRRAPVYLRRCAASLQPLPGTLALRGADASVAELRCEGARLRRSGGSYEKASLAALAPAPSTQKSAPRTKVTPASVAVPRRAAAWTPSPSSSQTK